jgi:hypothetical protein
MRILVVVEDDSARVTLNHQVYKGSRACKENTHSFAYTHHRSHMIARHWQAQDLHEFILEHNEI